LTAPSGCFCIPEVWLFDLDHEADALHWLAKVRTKHYWQTVSTVAGEPVETILADMADGR